MHENIRPAGRLFLGLLILASASAVHAARVEVNVNEEALGQVDTVVVLPLGCGSTAECLKLEDAVAQMVEEELGARVVPRERLDRVIDWMGLSSKEPHPTVMRLLAQEVGADAYLMVRSPKLELEDVLHVRRIRSGSRCSKSRSQIEQTSYRSGSLGLEVVTTQGVTLIEGRSRGPYGLYLHLQGMLQEAVGSAVKARE